MKQLLTCVKLHMQKIRIPVCEPNGKAKCDVHCEAMCRCHHCRSFWNEILNPQRVPSFPKCGHRWLVVTKSSTASMWQLSLCCHHHHPFSPRDAMLVWYLPSSYVRPSICLSVISRCSTKMAKPRIMQATSYDSPGTLVFWFQKSRWNSNGVTPNGGAKLRWGRFKRRFRHLWNSWSSQALST